MTFMRRLLGFIKARYAPRGARQTFSQCGEDIVMRDILSRKGVKRIFYIDIGAHHPVFGNNTYLFYKNGGSGALVEPNESLCKLIKRKRSRDLCINAGAGAQDGEADFYSFPQSTRSTFSSSQAVSWERSSGQKPVIEKRAVLSLDTIIRDRLQGKTPDIVSIDAEGMDLPILSAFSWSVRPKVFCIESMDGLSELMKSKGYELKARIFQNEIYADQRL